jgi:hypothetical protein
MTRTKSEDSHPKDKLSDGGMRVRTNKGHAAEKSNNTTQIKQRTCCRKVGHHTDLYLSVFMTK